MSALDASFDWGMFSFPPWCEQGALATVASAVPTSAAAIGPSSESLEGMCESPNVNSASAGKGKVDDASQDIPTPLEDLDGVFAMSCKEFRKYIKQKNMSAADAASLRAIRRRCMNRLSSARGRLKMSALRLAASQKVVQTPYTEKVLAFLREEGPSLIRELESKNRELTARIKELEKRPQ